MKSTTSVLATYLRAADAVTFGGEEKLQRQQLLDDIRSARDVNARFSYLIVTALVVILIIGCILALVTKGSGGSTGTLLASGAGGIDILLVVTALRDTWKQRMSAELLLVLLGNTPQNEWLPLLRTYYAALAGSAKDVGATRSTPSE